MAWMVPNQSSWRKLLLISGWAVSEGESRNWEYWLTIYHAKKSEDSDVFTCKTPRGKRNSVNVVVTGEANDALSRVGQMDPFFGLEFGIHKGISLFLTPNNYY